MILAPESCGCERPSEESASIVNSGVCSGTFLFMVLLEGFLKGRCSIATPCSRVKSMDNINDSYDFIVVGAGAAGSVVAGRLSENENFKVLLLEAGPDEPIGSRVPGFYRSFWNNKDLDWGFHTVPSKDYCRNENDGCTWLRAKVLGGCTVINGLMYHRGHPADYDEWVKDGAKGWSWDENYPHFLKTEGNKEIGSIVSAKLHNDSGPMPVQRYRYQPPFIYDLINAINSTGLPINSEFNDPEKPEGFAIAQTMNANGQRYSTARAFLNPTSVRKNFHLKLKAYVTRIIIKDIDGQLRTVGVEYMDENGTLETITANKEVILSAGALKTPHILMLSGVGPKETLEQFDIPVHADLPVGQNLINHFGMTINFILSKLKNQRTLDWSVLTQYLLKEEGPLTADSITQFSGMLYSSLANKSKKQPDIQYFFNGLYPECSQTGVIGESIDSFIQMGTNITVNIVALLPKSVGYMTLQSDDPFDSPLFYPNFFSHPDDMTVLRDGAKYLRAIVTSKALKQKYGIRLDPMTSKVCKLWGFEWSDKWVDCMARTYTDAQNHQMGTAAIGHVLDTDLHVRGISGLRVIDASSIPKLVSGNPQGVIMMVAERGAEFIKKEWL